MENRLTSKRGFFRGADHCIQPGSPSRMQMSNATTERFAMNGLSITFETIEEAQQISTEWLWTYNNQHPKSERRRRYTRPETEKGRVSSTVVPCENEEDYPQILSKIPLTVHAAAAIGALARAQLFDLQRLQAPIERA